MLFQCEVLFINLSCVGAGKISALLYLLLVSPLFTSCTTAESTSGKCEDGV